MEKELKQKQIFLRTNILDKGYDADQFMNFLQSKKGDMGLDLNNWTINELILSVEEFTSQYNNKQNNKNSQENNEINNQSQNEEEDNKKEIIKCEKISENELSQTENCDIKLSFPEKVEGGLFSKSYVTYLIQTSPLGFKVRKRYSDFEWLRNILSNMYINCVIPPLCKKNFSDRFSENLISKRTRSIEKFMKGILIHPILKNSQIFFDFISIDNEQDFEKRKKIFNKINPPNKLVQVKSINGELDVTLNQEKEIYFSNIKDNAELNEEILQKITKGYKSLIILMDQISDKLKEISELWMDIYKKSIKYYEKENTSETYNIMSKVMMDWSEVNKKQKILINEGIREYFRYIKNEFHVMSDLALKVENKKNIYIKAFDKLILQKENLFKQDINTWGLSPEDMENRAILYNNRNLAYSKMMPKETKIVNDIRRTYGFYLNSLIYEFERIRELNDKRHKAHIISFIKSLSESLTDFNVYINDRISYYEEINENKEEQKKG